MKNNIILKKIILPLVLLIFTQQELYGMQNDEKYEQLANSNENSGGNLKKNIWETVNEWVNGATKNDRPKLWWLWAIVDNIPFQYGGSKIWKHGEAYYGLNNGIGFFPSFLNFGWMKIGIIDLHIDLIIDIIHFCRNNVYWKVNNEDYSENVCVPLLFYDLFGQGTHFLSFKMFNGIKIRLISIFWVIFLLCSEDMQKSLFETKNITQKSWYYKDCNFGDNLHALYAVLCPRIEINIPKLINYFKGC